jgi:hypothetical protein
MYGELPLSCREPVVSLIVERKARCFKMPLQSIWNIDGQMSKGINMVLFKSKQILLTICMMLFLNIFE